MKIRIDFPRPEPQYVELPEDVDPDDEGAVESWIESHHGEAIIPFEDWEVVL
ncbi:hypothetical protein [Amycolatopsis sp. PS_44_ISF1]|uniref:hypothetical protein n=1 Tax=Amycolatopsis sp. PS_44_ISF1 TaxID=2974917 RepID=UPI0028DD537A|nr:hypothetical protein [Amycolatopsis sp. PS_44_ISF1]MDT8915810.1 hypothetical protein [Amycolatopsis sp. PS_44_ISF1]